MRVVAAALIGAAGVVAAALGWRRARRPCPTWPAFLIENPYTDLVAPAAQQIERAGLRPGMCVLDAGCGPGRVTLPAAVRVGSAGTVVALDVQARMLGRLEDRLTARDIGNVEPRRASLGAGGLERARFDVAILSAVLGEVHDRPAALGEIHQALRPGGILSVSDVLPNPMYLSPGRVRALARAAGFVERERFAGWMAYTINFVVP